MQCTNPATHYVVPTCWCGTIHLVALSSLIYDDDPDQRGTNHTADHGYNDDASCC